VFILGVLFIGCSRSTSEAAGGNTAAQASGPQVLKIGVLDRNADEEAHIKFGESIQDAAKGAGVTCLYSATGEDMVAVRSTLSSYIAQGCNVIVDFLSSMETSEAISEECERAGVFHICIDADPRPYTYFYGLSNGDAGDVLGNYLVNYIRDKMNGTIDMLLLMDSPSHGEDVAKRTENPRKILLDNGLITVEQVSYISLTLYDLESVRQRTVDFLTTHADRRNIVMISFASSFNDAIYSASKTQSFDNRIHLFSYDGLDATVNILKTGEPSITKGEVSAGIDKYGYDVLAIAQRLIAGEQVPHASYAAAEVMDADNVFQLHPDN
jgi:ABC-type sugar transport system substrate-binding protein